MRVDVFWVAGPWRGRIGIVPRPRGGDWLGDETSAWRQAGIDVAVSLLEPDEAVQLGLEDEAAAAAASGLDFRVLPIPDRGVPASRESVAELTNTLLAALNAGKNVAVHCRQGIGRSSLIVAAVLVAGGVTLTDALRAAEQSRGIPVPETDEQRRWLEDFVAGRLDC